MKRDWYWMAYKESKMSQFSMSQMIRLMRAQGNYTMNYRTASKKDKVLLGEKYDYDGFFWKLYCHANYLKEDWCCFGKQDGDKA